MFPVICGVKVTPESLWLKFTLDVPAPPFTVAAWSVPDPIPLPVPIFRVPELPACWASVKVPVPALPPTVTTLPFTRFSVPVPPMPMTRSPAVLSWLSVPSTVTLPFDPE